jgi:predicted methyltransferase
MKDYRLGAAALLLFACTQQVAPAPATPDAEGTAPGASSAPAAERLDAVLTAQSDEVKARYAHRHPKETLQFFGVEPGMTVVDTLPGPVWYAGLLLDYLGSSGKVIAADYGPEMWTKFGEYSPDPKQKANWPADTMAKMETQRSADDAAVGAFQYGSIPDELAGTVDVVLAIRALHHFMRLEASDGYMTKALADMKKVLKPGGIVGVEQHRAPETSSDAWAKGDSGYVKQSAVIAAFEKAGFELAGSSEVNANPKDQPTDKDMVWRLPPTLATSQSNPELKAQMEAIGETDRMTLKFRKPS